MTTQAPQRPRKPHPLPHNARPDADWEAIEREYRAGVLSVDEIGRAYGVSRPGIDKRAKRLKWERDLTARVKRAAHTRLASGDNATRTAVEEVNAQDGDATIVDAAADRIVQVVREHRTTIRQGRALCEALIGELREATECNGIVEETVREVTNDDRDGRRRQQMLRAISLPARAATMRDLAAAAKTLITLERQAFGIDDDPRRDQQPTSLGSMIEAVVKMRRERDGQVIDITPTTPDTTRPQTPQVTPPSTRSDFAPKSDRGDKT